MGITAIDKQIQVVETTDERIVTAIEKKVQVVAPINAVINLGGRGGEWVIGETPTGAVNGSNATFTSEFDFVPESVEVFDTGVRVALLDDYTTTGNRTIQMTQSPTVGGKIRINYLKQ